MGHFIPVQYMNHVYPNGILPRLYEVPAHFDAKPFTRPGPFSLHTEFSYGPRKFTAPAVQGFEVLTSTVTSEGTPALWASRAWAGEFAQYIPAFTGGAAPTVVEIYPPFTAYATLPEFLDRYSLFEEKLTDVYPKVRILVENRCGNMNRGLRFTLSTAKQLTEFSTLLDKSPLRLKITLDLPQLFSAHNLSAKNQWKGMTDIIEQMRDIRHNICGIHLWGKRPDRNGRPQAHFGDLNTYFGDPAAKELFLSQLRSLLDDERPRLLVPEVNGGEADFLSIINDLLQAGFTFHT